MFTDSKGIRRLKIGLHTHTTRSDGKKTPEEAARICAEAEAEEDRIITAQIVESIDKVIKDYLAANPDKKDEVKKLVTKYVKNGDYFAIKESTLAGKLLQEVQASIA